MDISRLNNKELRFLAKEVRQIDQTSQPGINHENSYLMGLLFTEYGYHGNNWWFVFQQIKSDLKDEIWYRIQDNLFKMI